MDFFNSTKYVISLPKSTTRRANFDMSATNAGLKNFDCIMAVDAADIAYEYQMPQYRGVSNIKKILGQTACRLSHLSVIKKAKKENLPYVIICEDDADFDPYFKEKLTEWQKEIPADWQLLYFGAHNFRPLEMVSEHIGKCVTSLSTICYAVKSDSYDLFIEKLHADEILDIIYCNHIVTKMNLPAYCFKPNLVFQRSGFSDIEGMNVDYTKYYQK